MGDIVLAINMDFKYHEFELDSLDNSGSFTATSAATDWPRFFITGRQTLENITAIKILQVEIPFSWYVFNVGNNTWTMTETDGTTQGSVTVTMPVGNYTSASAATALGTALSAVTGYGATYTVSFNSSTQKFTITATGGTLASWNFVFGNAADNGTSNPRLFLGFPPGITYSLTRTMTAPNAALISGPNYIYVNSQKLGNLVDLYLPQGASTIGGGNCGTQIAKIPVNVQSGGIIFWQDPAPEKWFTVDNLLVLNEIDFFISLGNSSSQKPLPLNGLGFSIKLGVLTNTKTRTEIDGNSLSKRIRPY